MTCGSDWKPPLCRSSSQCDRSSGPECSSCSKSIVGVCESQWKDRRGSKQRQMRHDMWMTIVFKTQRCAILILSHACSRDAVCTLYVLYLWVSCSQTLKIALRPSGVFLVSFCDLFILLNLNVLMIGFGNVPPQQLKGTFEGWQRVLSCESGQHEIVNVEAPKP